jgi:hypothetical protein
MKKNYFQEENIMKKSQKLLSMLLATVALGSTLAGCGGNGDKTTTIYVMNFGGGVGRAWLDNAIERFTATKEGYSYEAGKTGVTFEVENSIDTGVETMSSSGYNIYFDSTSPTALSLQQSGSVICIDDIVKEKSDTRNGVSISIEDKLDEKSRAAFQGADGKYYALPNFALYPGVTYNVDLFEEEEMYIAKPGQAADKMELENSTYGQVYFAVNGGEKSCGNDGVYGTYDDGLPTSLVEFLVLCDRMDSNGIEPLSFRPGYESYLIEALWASLAGAESYETQYTYTGTIEHVVSLSETENLFEGIDYIKKPITQTTTINRGTGYLANDNVARYYAMAMTEILETEGWISNYAYVGTLTHIDYMTNFVFSGKQGKTKQGMFLEGDYWYNEAKDNNVLSEYETLTKDKNRRMAWMPLPTAVYDSVTPGNGREYTMSSDDCNFAFINANIADNAGLVQACKDFLKFCYSDAELSAFTACTGVYKSSMDYPLDNVMENMSYFTKSVAACRSASTTVAVDGYKDALYNNNLYYPTLDKKYGSYWKAMRVGKTTEDIWEATRTQANGWGVVNH